MVDTINLIKRLILSLTNKIGNLELIPHLVILGCYNDDFFYKIENIERMKHYFKEKLSSEGEFLGFNLDEEKQELNNNKKV